MDDIELGSQKFQDFQEGQEHFMQDSKPCRFKILGNSRLLEDFEWFCLNSHQNFKEINGIPVKLTEHILQDFQPKSFSGGGGFFLE